MRLHNFSIFLFFLDDSAFVGHVDGEAEDQFEEDDAQTPHINTPRIAPSLKVKFALSKVEYFGWHVLGSGHRKTGVQLAEVEACAEINKFYIF